MGDYYSDIMSIMIAHASELKSPHLELKTPRATFQMRGEFNDTSKFLAHNFVVDFTGLYGDFVKPIALENGCISLRLEFTKTSDYFGRSFTDIILNDTEYHDLFKKYDVFKIIAVWFPQLRNQTGTYRIGPAGRPI
ncbi:MAG: hypothetical protein KDE25_02845 [Novosphingobium sp.]|nr:hypothetical protein [Novosphingobium sp.]